MASNPIENSIEQLTEDWSLAVEQADVRLVRILSEYENQSLIDTFFDYLLAIDIESDTFVFCSETEYTDTNAFCRSIVKEIEEEVQIWNTANIPEDIPHSEINWKADLTIEDPITLLTQNLNSFSRYVSPDEKQKICLVLKQPAFTKKEATEFFSEILKQDLVSNLRFTVADYKEGTLYDKLSSQYSTEVKTIIPSMDIAGLAEQLASQEVNEGSADSLYRMYLMRLFNKAKTKDSKGVMQEAKNCLDIISKEIENDVNWISQIVTVYTVIYGDKLRLKDYKEALYFSDKAVEAATLSEGKIDPTLSYRLMGQTLTGNGAILCIQKQWEKAVKVYEQATKAYESCGDYLMQCETLRLSAWVKEHNNQKSDAIDDYIKAFYLVNKMTPEIAKHSTYPLIVQKLLDSTIRLDKLSDKEMDNVLSPILGEEWRSYVKEYRKN